MTNIEVSQTITDMFKPINEKLGKIENELVIVKKYVLDINMTIENELRPNIMRVVEGQFEIYNINMKVQESEIKKLKTKIS